jgi:hypothetical protein
MPTELLHVTPTDKLDDPIFAQLQLGIDDKLLAGVKPGKVNHAPRGIRWASSRDNHLSLSRKACDKLSGPEPLLKI